MGVFALAFKLAAIEGILSLLIVFGFRGIELHSTMHLFYSPKIPTCTQFSQGRVPGQSWYTGGVTHGLPLGVPDPATHTSQLCCDPCDPRPTPCLPVPVQSPPPHHTPLAPSGPSQRQAIPLNALRAPFRQAKGGVIACWG